VDAQVAINSVVDLVSEQMFARNNENRFIEVSLRSGRREVLYRGDLCSGAIVASIVQRAKESAIKRAIETKGQELGIRLADLEQAIEDEYRENDIFPTTDSVEDWLQLIDYEPENVVKIAPIRPEKGKRRQSTVTVI
jgi:proteasome-associated ATPase